jgi:hypothetical protein
LIGLDDVRVEPLPLPHGGPMARKQDVLDLIQIERQLFGEDAKVVHTLVAR